MQLESKNSNIDKALSNGIKDGNHADFEKLYKAFFEPLFHFAKDYVISKDVARNIVQDSFLLLWEKRIFIDPGQSLKSFLYTITKNKCLNYLSREKTKLKVNTKIQQSYFDEIKLNYQALQQLPLEKLSFDELQELIAKATEKLPPKTKLVFEMSRYEGFKNVEISEKLNISPKTVEWHITQSLKVLREQLKKYYKSEILSQIILFL